MNNLNHELFLRPMINDNEFYYQYLEQKLNLSSLNHWTKRKTIKLFNEQYQETFLSYRFNILRQWYLKNQTNEEILEEKLNKLVKHLMLGGYLNATEKNYLINLENNNFTKLRNIKSLVTDFDLNKNEIAYFHYYLISMKFNHKIYYMISLYITNQRIIVLTKEMMISFYFEYLEQFKIHQDELSFKYFDHHYSFKSNKINILKTSLERLQRW